MPALMSLLDNEAVPVTFFVTGATAERYPETIAGLAARGHEIGCHGYSHGSFAEFGQETAEHEVLSTNTVLRRFSPVRSFRAPYLRFPERYLPILERNGICNDASRARYKWQETANHMTPGVRRLSASIPTSLTRLPAMIRTPILRALRDPVVLFVHPWEFVDLADAPIPFDCRYRTGEPALDDLRDVINHFRARGARFCYVDPDWTSATCA